jgi:diguanylate cyclase (GGDEF)-like protein
MSRLFFADDVERERLLGLTRLLLAPIAYALAILTVPIVLAGSHYGWGLVVPIVAGVLGFLWAAWSLDRVRHPEWALAGAWALSIVMVQASFAVAHGPREYLYSMSLISTLLLAMVFGRRFVMAGTAATVAAMVASALLFDRAEVSTTPLYLFVACVLIVAVALLGVAARDADVLSRETAVIDSLTRVLNRIALRARLSELEAQSRVRPQMVAMIVTDIDNFKAINDVHGHAFGDRVLTEVASRLRAALDSTATLYRFGGEEFVVLIPAADSAAALIVAERLRLAVSDGPVGDVAITISCGVGVSTPTAVFDRHAVFEAADASLYAAKRGGRNRTMSAIARPTGPRTVRRDPATRSRPTALAADAAPVDIDARARRHRETRLIRNDAQRQQLVDVAARTRTPTIVAETLILVTLIAGAPWFGWMPVIPVLLLIPLRHVLGGQVARSTRPETLVFGVCLVAIGAIGLSTALMAPAALISLPLCTLIAFPVCVALPRRGAVLIWFSGAAVILLVALLSDPGAALHDPAALLLPEAQLAAVCVIADALGRSTTEHRSLAIVDLLTGLLNRAALEARLPEIEYAANLSGAPVAILVGDIDLFKPVNDEHGHARGDAVLRGVAQRLRGALRPFDPVYRIGGEEFLVLLDSTSAQSAAEVAERARAAIAHRPIAGIEITMSFGVCASPTGRPFDYATCFAAADRALYLAKAQGRNRVVVSDTQQDQPTARNDVEDHAPAVFAATIA